MLFHSLYPVAVALLLGSAVAALCCYRHPKIAGAVGWIGVLAGALSGIVAQAFQWYSGITGTIPFAGFFRLPILILAAAGAVHSIGYLKGHGGERAGLYFFFYNLTAAAMLSTTLLRHPIAFLFAWEIMGLASFALIYFDYRAGANRRAAWIYLAACQAGAVFLILLFALHPGPTACFILALIGFGLKIGFPGLHVWLPEAHPAAPAPVSALMSGAMIQLGFYGLLLFGMKSVLRLELYGTTLLTLGCVGALGGALFALPQNNLKKLLAYSSIENMGLIAMGFGLGFLGMHTGNASMTACGFGGAMLHLLNHALNKGGLFLSAGTILRTEGTLELDRMGGMLRRAPRAGWLFLLHALSLCGLPPFSGFLSEFLICCAALAGIAAGAGPWIVAGSTAALVVLALTGGVAAAVFAKAVGAALLGEPRSKAAENAVEPSRWMTIPVSVLFGLSLLLLPFARTLLLKFIPSSDAETALLPLRAVAFWSAAAFLGGSILFWLRNRLAARSGIRETPTWDCGYAAPSARMEYTGTAFAQPLTDFFAGLLRPKKEVLLPQGDFPSSEKITETVDDRILEGFWGPVCRFLERLAQRIHGLQSGSLHLYLLIMLLALLALLVWAFVLPGAGTAWEGGR